MKKLVIGDIHGCYTELMDLLDRAGLTSEDEIIAVGDLVDRGPDSPRVLEFFRSHPQARSLLGNHERKHLRSYRKEISPALSQQIARQQFGEERYREAIAFMETLPIFFEFPEALVVHGFFEPDIPLEEQREVVLVGTMSGDGYLQKRYPRPWYELYTGDKPIIVGHLDYLRNRQPLIYQDRVFGIDTGCCHGGALTGLLLPDFRIVSVPSRKDYWSEVKGRYEDLRLESAPDESLRWDQIERLTTLAEQRSDLATKVSERMARLTPLLAEAGDVLERLYAHIVAENQRILSELRAEDPFDKSSLAEQARRYAHRIGRTPMAPFLHMARKGELTLDALRKRFGKPAQVIAFARKIGFPL
jgi:serine/threonine protein phosphatase 1